MGKSSKSFAVIAAALLTLQFANTPVFAQAGAAGGTVGKSGKSASGGNDEPEPEHRSKSHSEKRAAPRDREESRGSASADGSWTVTANAGCVPPWSLTIMVSDGVISGSGSSGSVSRSGAIHGNTNILGFRFDVVGHIHGRAASGTFIGPNNCTGQWTGAKS
jgi:hypothetical protein